MRNTAQHTSLNRVKMRGQDEYLELTLPLKSRFEGVVQSGLMGSTAAFGMNKLCVYTLEFLTFLPKLPLDVISPVLSVIAFVHAASYGSDVYSDYLARRDGVVLRRRKAPKIDLG